jgi:signal transduction histidine kinase
MRVGQKMILGFMLVALLGGVIGYFGFRSTTIIHGEFKKLGDETIPVVTALEDLKYASLRVVSSTSEFCLIKEESKTAEGIAGAGELELIRDGTEGYDNAFKQYETLVSKYFPEEEEVLENIKNQGQKLHKTSAEIIELKRQGISGDRILEKKEEFEKNEQAFLRIVNNALASEDKELAERKNYVESAIASAVTTIVVTSIVIFIMSLVLGLFISRSISNPISKLKDTAIEIGKGDLSKRAQVVSKDEVGVLAVSFNQMTDEIQKRNEGLQTMNEELQSTNEELESSNEELRSTTEELETSNEELQSTTEELEASNEELRTANEEREQTQEKLIQQEKLAAVGQLASGVGHELRNPLGVIKNAAYYIKTKVGTGDDKLAKHLAIMEREINNSNRIISDLLGFSRTRLPSISPSDVNEIVENAMEVVEIPENVLLVKEFDTSLPKVMVDPDQMHQVFVNLGLNAVQAMTDGGQLKVKIRLAGDYVEVEFSDTGCGIPQENLKKLFDPFFSTKARGVGLGLAVTHGIIERNKCKIEVKSKVSEGTVFTVKLPVEKQTSEKEASDKQKVTVS